MKVDQDSTDVALLREELDRAQKPNHVLKEIALGLDRNPNQLIDATGRLEGAVWAMEQGVILRFSRLLKQVPIRLTEKNIRSIMEEALDRRKRGRKFGRRSV